MLIFPPSFLCFQRALIPSLGSPPICFIGSVMWVSIPRPEGQGAIGEVWQPVADSTAYSLWREKALPTSLPLTMWAYILTPLNAGESQIRSDGPIFNL